MRAARRYEIHAYRANPAPGSGRSAFGSGDEARLMAPRCAGQDIDHRVSDKLRHRFGSVHASLHVAGYRLVLHSLHARNVRDCGALTRRIELNVERSGVVRSRCAEREVYDFDHLVILPRR